MRNSSWILGLVLLGAGVFFHLPDAAVEAGPQSAAETVRGYHLRVVLVRRSAEPRLAPPSWEQVGAAARTTLTWKQARDELRKRGAVEIMLDQNGSAADGKLYKFDQSVEYPVMRPQRRDANKETLQLHNVRVGCSGSLMVRELLEYQYRVSWLHWRDASQMVPTAKSSWEGTAAPLAPGETLIVHSRVDTLSQPGLGTTLIKGAAQSRPKPGTPAVVEIYCFLTATPAGSTAAAEAADK